MFSSASIVAAPLGLRPYVISGFVRFLFFIGVLPFGVPLNELPLPGLLRVHPLLTSGTARRITLLRETANFFRDPPFPCARFFKFGGAVQYIGPPVTRYCSR